MSVDARFSEILDMAAKAPSGQRIVEECLCLARLLVEKNRLYGDSALNPKRIFSRASATEQIRVRIDDKLSRIEQGETSTEDTVQDLLGYLVLLRIAEKPQPLVVRRLHEVLLQGCQECEAPVAKDAAICDNCYERRFGQQKRLTEPSA